MCTKHLQDKDWYLEIFWGSPPFITTEKEPQTYYGMWVLK